MTFADQLTIARAAAAPLVVFLFAVDFTNHDYWGTAVFCAAMSVCGCTAVTPRENGSG